MSSCIDTDLSSYSTAQSLQVQTRKLFNAETGDFGLTMQSVGSWMDILTDSYLSVGSTTWVGVSAGSFIDFDAAEWIDVEAGTSGAFTAQTRLFNSAPDWYTRSTTLELCTTRGGNTGYSEVDDSALGGGDIKLISGQDLDIFTQRDVNLTVTGAYALSVTGNYSDVIHGNSTETVSGNQIISVTGSRTDTIHGDDTTTVFGNNLLSVSGNDTLTSGGFTNVTAGTTMNLFSVQDMFIGTSGDLHINVSQDLILAVTGDESTTINGDSTTVIAGTDTLTVNTFLQTTTNNYTIGVGGDSYFGISGANVMNSGTSTAISAGTSLSIFSVDGIDISTTGNVVLNAYEFIVNTVQPFGLTSTDVNLTATGSLELSAGTTMLISASGLLEIDANDGLIINVSGADFVINSQECIDITSADCIEITAGTTMTLTAGAGLILNVTGNDLQINSQECIDIISQDCIELTAGTTISLLTPGKIDIDAGSNLHVTVSGAYNTQVTGNYLLNATGAIDIATDSSTGNINIGTGSIRNIDIGTPNSNVQILGSAVEIGTGTTGVGLVTIASNAIVMGDFTVYGTRTELAVQELLVDDNLIQLNAGSTFGRSPLTAQDGGLQLWTGTTTSAMFVWDANCPTGSLGSTSTGAIGTWTTNQHINVDLDRTYNIDCKLALSENQLMIDATTPNGGIYFNGSQSLDSPQDQDIRLRAITIGGRQGLIAEKYNTGTTSWKSFWKIIDC